MSAPFESDPEIGAPVQAARQSSAPHEMRPTGGNSELIANAENAGMTVDSSASAGSAPLVVDAAGLARLLKISVKTIDRQLARNELPRPILIGRQHAGAGRTSRPGSRPAPRANANGSGCRAETASVKRIESLIVLQCPI